MEIKKTIVQSLTPPRDTSVLWLNPEDGSIQQFNASDGGWKSISGGGGIEEITHAELKKLRDNSQLVPGKQYRIIDYVTTIDPGYTETIEGENEGETIDVPLMSMEYPFDIIVTADSVNSLSENARVAHTKSHKEPTDYIIVVKDGEFSVFRREIRLEKELSLEDSQVLMYTGVASETLPDVSTINLFDPKGGCNYFVIESGYKVGDEIDLYGETAEVVEMGTIEAERGDYFKNSELSSWNIKYCLDNDKSRFSWACPETLSVYNRAAIVDMYSKTGPGFQVKKFDAIYIKRDAFGKWWIVDTVSEIDPIEAEEISTSDLSEEQWNSEAIVEFTAMSDSQIQNKKETSVIIGQYTHDYNVNDLSEMEEVISDHGKGVIYYMKDEHNNEICFDFKNLWFEDWASYRPALMFTYTPFDGSLYPGLYGDNELEYIQQANILQTLRTSENTITLKMPLEFIYWVLYNNLENKDYLYYSGIYNLLNGNKGD